MLFPALALLLAIRSFALEPSDIGSVGTLATRTGDCSGVLVSPRWVLTAAHCVDGEPPTTLVFSLSPERDPKAPKAEAVASFIHPGWIRKGRWAREADVALVQLGSEDYGPRPAKLLALATPGASYNWTGALVAGYGPTAKEDSGKRRLKKVLIKGPVTDPSEAFGKSLFEVKAGDEGEFMCVGDSGGPILKHVDGQLTIVAIVSLGIVDANVMERAGRAPGDLGARFSCQRAARQYATSVAYVRDWIEQTQNPRVVAPAPTKPDDSFSPLKIRRSTRSPSGK